MYPHGGGLPQGPGEIVLAIPWQTLFVERVAPFVGRGQEGGEGLARHDPGGDAEVLGTDRAGKRMGRPGALAAARVIAPTLQQLGTKGLLGPLGKIKGLDWADVLAGSGAPAQLGGPLQQGRQLLLEGGE